MEQTKKSTFKLLFYLKKNELKKNGNAPIMARITIDGTPKTFGTKLEIDPNNWDLKHGRVQGKSAQALSINKKLDNIRGRIDKIYEDMLKHEGFATAQKVKLSFLGVGVMDDAILKVFLFLQIRHIAENFVQFFLRNLNADVFVFVVFNV
ncbi:Arm DNA-binding domain-containing protein [uncultured Pedobacter sp.]|uniref:Arm DNA-binding domain-containing protein n=1 Tax=uncultured Pedobacter sp. TaxID=246139 RepID=UPI0025E8B392|nr:Arm DNA-binding domain-containing protein [uncultured Pedobacter sp.]